MRNVILLTIYKYQYCASFTLCHILSKDFFYFADNSSSGQNIVTVPPIGEDELPPPYTPSSQGSMPMINCKVCQSMINIEGKTHQHVVKCNVCNEATVSYHYI